MTTIQILHGVSLKIKDICPALQPTEAIFYNQTTVIWYQGASLTICASKNAEFICVKIAATLFVPLSLSVNGVCPRQQEPGNLLAVITVCDLILN